MGASYMMHTMVHTWRGRVCSIFIEINVKRQSNPRPLKVCSIQRCTAHIQPIKIISKYDCKKCASFWHNSRGNYRLLNKDKQNAVWIHIFVSGPAYNLTLLEEQIKTLKSLIMYRVTFIRQ